jgi:hypothetical protein
LSAVNSWFKTCCALSRRRVVRLVYSTATVLVSIILLGSTTLPQSDSGSPGVSANELARKIVRNELKFQDEDHGHWMYRLEKEESGKKQVQEIVETKDGSLTRLLSIDSRPLDATQQQKEDQRIQRLVSNPDEQRKLQQARNKRAEQGERLFKLLPDAFVFNYAGGDGNLVKLSFRPNPKFHPPSLEARVFHDIEGEMWVDCKQERLAMFNGRLTQDAKFGLGLLGHLDRGGHFEVRQAEVAPGFWEMTVLSVDMKGKALLFKTVGVHETENHSDFHRVPNDLALAEAADILNRQIFVASNR